MLRHGAALLLCMLSIAGCTRSDIEVSVPLRTDLGGFHMTITTNSDLAQAYFDQGLIFYYGFNHDAAIASFEQAAALDSTCAMAYWGQALSAGPNINNPYMDSAAAYNAFKAVREALTHAKGAAPVEQALIGALAHRYAWPVPENRAALDSAYSDAMREVAHAYANDVDVQALAADAMMNLRPWDLWTPTGAAQPGTHDIVSILEAALALQQDHPGVCHLYIHTMEASPFPDKALGAADVLRTRVPAAGHLLHMPSHIDIRLGRYEAAIEANLRGIQSDSSWLRADGFYNIYRAHNYHFLAYAAMFDGQRERALRAAQDIRQTIPIELVRAFPDFLDAFMAVPIHVMVRFGLWHQLLAESKPADDMPAHVAFWHYGRTVALAALDRTPEAVRELAALRSAIRAVPESRMLGNNTVHAVLAVGLPHAEGEVAYRTRHYAQAFASLATAVRRDDELRYDEPWGWMMPVRHSLGALLLEQGRIVEAEAVYREDLRLHPENGWALHGLAECLHRLGRHQEAEETDILFKSSWSRADVDIAASCYCRLN